MWSPQIQIMKAVTGESSSCSITRRPINPSWRSEGREDGSGDLTRFCKRRHRQYRCSCRVTIWPLYVLWLMPCGPYSSDQAMSDLLLCLWGHCSVRETVWLNNVRGWIKEKGEEAHIRLPTDPVEINVKFISEGLADASAWNVIFPITPNFLDDCKIHMITMICNNMPLHAHSCRQDQRWLSYNKYKYKWNSRETNVISLFVSKGTSKAHYSPITSASQEPPWPAARLRASNFSMSMSLRRPIQPSSSMSSSCVNSVNGRIGSRHGPPTTSLSTPALQPSPPDLLQSFHHTKVTFVQLSQPAVFLLSCVLESLQSGDPKIICSIEPVVRVHGIATNDNDDRGWLNLAKGAEPLGLLDQEAQLLLGEPLSQPGPPPSMMKCF